MLKEVIQYFDLRSIQTTCRYRSYDLLLPTSIYRYKVMLLEIYHTWQVFFHSATAGCAFCLHTCCRDVGSLIFPQ